MPIQLDAILALLHQQASRAGAKRQGNYQAYENLKARLRCLKLTPDEYEREARQVAAELGI